MESDFQTKFIKLKVINMLSQNELNRLLEHLRNLSGFEFSVDCEVYTATAKPTTEIDVLNTLNEVKKRVLPFGELSQDSN